MMSNYSTDNAHLGKHDVFLSFRGYDTRTNFVSFLHRELVVKNGIETYIDYRLDGGEEIEPSLLKKIQESLISVVIFSQNYANSIFCLRELSTILECKKTKDQIIIPVFYQVDPADVQEPDGSYAKQLSKFKGKYNPKEMESWENALNEIANLKGWDSNFIKPDTILVEKIVDDVQKKLRHMPLLSSPSKDSKSLVGIDSRINEVKSSLRIGSTNRTILLGIWGMPGMGKTTIAHAVYHRISHLFDGCCFFNHVREESQKRGLQHVRKQILCEILEKKDLSNMSDSEIQRMLQRKKVLIVLDDVSSPQQLNEALGEDGSLGKGSRIVVTSRDIQLLEDHCDVTYEVAELDNVDAFKLFKLHAFKGNQCPEGFKDLSERAVNYAAGNPLSLKVLGSNLYNKGIKVWENMLADPKLTLDTDMQKILMMSYDGLDWKQKRIFLDIACFFVRCRRDRVQQALDCCGFDAKNGIDRLIDLGLLNISEKDEIWMDDLIKQLGQDIVQQENFDDPRKRSRLWVAEDILHVLTHHEGTETLQAMSLNMEEIDRITSNRQISLSPAVFKGMCNLRLLEIYFPSSVWEIIRILFESQGSLIFPEGIAFLPNKLRILHWDRYPLESLPSNFYPLYLVELHLFQSEITELWKEEMPLVNLKVLEVIWAKKLITIKPVLSNAPKLEVLNLSCCISLVHLPYSIEGCTELTTLHLGNCTRLEGISRKIGQLKRLAKLDLSSCSRLANLPKSIGWLKCLTQLDLSSCSELTILPDSIGRLKHLEELDLSRCLKLATLPNSIGSLVSLTKLDLSESNIEGIPESIKQLPKLTSLILCKCKRLQFLPELPSSLLYIDAGNCCHLQSVQSIFTKVDKRDFEAISEYFNFSCCYGLDQSSCMKIMHDAGMRMQTRLAGYVFEQECCYIFKLCIPGEEVPEWFSYKNRGHLLENIRPHPPPEVDYYGTKDVYFGLVLGAVVGIKDGRIPNSVGCKCHLITENGPLDLHFSYYEGIEYTYKMSWESKHVFIWYDWGNNINHSKYFFEEASFSFYAEEERLLHENTEFEVINCGVRQFFLSDLLLLL